MGERGEMGRKWVENGKWVEKVEKRKGIIQFICNFLLRKGKFLNFLENT